MTHSLSVVHVSWLLSSAGGGIPPVVFSLSRAQIAIGHGVHVLGIRDPHEEPLSGDVPCGVFPAYGPVALGWSPRLSHELQGTTADVLHLHGLFTWPSQNVRKWRKRTGRTVIVAPHGMLDPWALANSAWKKQLFSLVVEKDNLQRASCIHALSRAEAIAVRHLGIATPVAVVPNGVDLPSGPAQAGATKFGEVFREVANRRILLFLGRLHPKKGVEELLHAWARVRGDSRSSEWVLVIAGAGKQAYVRRLRKIAESHRLGRSLIFTGALDGDRKSYAFSAADAFVLPSFSEGLPMALLEAMAHRIPVLATRQCNIDVESIGAGLLCEPTLDSITEALRDLLASSKQVRIEFGKKGRLYVEKRHSWASVAQEMNEVYLWLTGHDPKPSNVFI